MTKFPAVDRRGGIFDSAAALEHLQRARQKAAAAVGGLLKIAIDHGRCRLIVGDYVVQRLTNAEGTRWNVTGDNGLPLEAYDDVAPAVAYAVSAAVTDLVYDAVCERGA